jgi:predicted phosphodiesterase
MRVAALSDLHGNLAALDAVLADVAEAGVDTLVFTGDVALGPFPDATIERLMELGLPARFVRGNCDRELVAAFDATPVEESLHDASWEAAVAWAAGRMSAAQRDFLARFEPSFTLAVDGLGPALFCHATPRSDEEIVTPLTPPAVLEPILDGVPEATVVVGHTHAQFDLAVGGTRLVNPGSVGMPNADAPGAYWAVLGPDVTMRRTEYDVTAVAQAIDRSGFPIPRFGEEHVLTVPSVEEAQARFEQMGAERRSRS